jgi:hypothetical protein
MLQRAKQALRALLKFYRYKIIEEAINQAKIDEPDRSLNIDY